MDYIFYSNNFIFKTSDTYKEDSIFIIAEHR